MAQSRKRKRQDGQGNSNDATSSYTVIAQSKKRKRRDDGGNSINASSSYTNDVSANTRQCTNSSFPASDFQNATEITEPILDFGNPNNTCPKCYAVFWTEEKTERLSQLNNPVYNLCCRQGRIKLPPLEPPPQTLSRLLDPMNGPDSSHFTEYIRMYNSMFAFTSLGVQVDESINDGRGPYVFKISGQLCHLMGSLLPAEDNIPRFAQLYMVDTAQEIDYRISHFDSNNYATAPRRHIVEALSEMLNQQNRLVQGFRLVRERVELHNRDNFRIRIRADNTSNERQYALPVASEIVGLVVGDLDGYHPSRDVIVESRSGQLQRISSINPRFMPFQYPLLYPRGEESFRDDIKYNSNVPSTSKVQRGYVTMLEYYCYRLHFRLAEPDLYFISSRLLQQFVVDIFCCIDQARLYYIQQNQKSLRSDTYNNIRTAALNGDMYGSHIGKRIILPATHVGSPRYLYQNYQDAIAICRHFGPPHLFITFTCNPLWREITDNLRNGQTPNDRPDLVCRVFKMKLDELIKDIKHKKHFGKIAALIYTVEFQKRGLPHVHIIVWLDNKERLTNPIDIDTYISAELPNPQSNPISYSIVTQYMMHGPCGPARQRSPCMKDGHCSKNFPKKFHDSTIMSNEGFVVYKRRDTGITTEKNGMMLDNKFVVPYNLKLLQKYRAHINVERCHTTTMIKYLFKYISKGRDRVFAVIESTGNNQRHQQGEASPIEQRTINEVTEYLDCRYIAPPEAMWRIFQYAVHYSDPTVERLPVHLPDENNVLFSDGQQLEDIANNPSVRRTKLTAWFDLNKKNEIANELTYPEVTYEFTWNHKEKYWDLRQKGDRLARMHFVHPKAGDLYYLRMLLHVIRGAKSFQDLRTVQGQLYLTFKGACEASGLLENDNEWIYTMQEAAASANSIQLRHIFIEILIFCQVSDAKMFWNSCWHYLHDDLLHQLRSSHNNPELTLNESILKDLVLHELQNMLSIRGHSLQSVNLPTPTTDQTFEPTNTLLVQQLSYNTIEMRDQLHHLIGRLNIEQKNAFDRIVDSVHKMEGGLFFVYGPGGTGKTYLWQAITVSIRSQGEVVLTVASSGLSSLLLQGGVTAYSRFKIPIKLTEETTCDIKKNTQLAELLKTTSLIIWDEAPMSNRICFEALDRTMRDILGDTNPINKHKTFGGVTVVLGGDFRQTLPVVPGGRNHETIAASITNSYLWSKCTVLELSTNMRLSRLTNGSTEREKVQKFATWLLSIGNGTEPAEKLFNSNEAEWVKIPDNLLLDPGQNAKQSIINATYPNFQTMYMNIPYLRQRAIITPKNETVDELNKHMLTSVPGDEHEYFSADSIDGVNNLSDDLRACYPIEFLNTITAGNLPHHHLILKVGTPIMLLRNIDQPNGLCNGTRAIVTSLGRRIIQARIITGTSTNKEVTIPRILFLHEDTNLPFILRRRQFPVRLCYAMTINKSQGQSLDMVGLYLPEPVFSHGQLYVALSRTTSPDGLKILITNQDGPYKGYTKNIVYRQIFNQLCHRN